MIALSLESAEIVKDTIYSQIENYFGNTISTYGPSPRGADWNSGEAQELRFSQLEKIIPPATQPGQGSLLDFGCGYGALLSYIRRRGLNCRYIGVDCVPRMIAEAKKLHKLDPYATFVCSREPTENVNIIVVSGSFNFKGKVEEADWKEFVLEQLDTINASATDGFAFNLLTSYSDEDKIRADLYYADPCFYFDYCKRHFSPNIALLHDYGAYEFTVLVRKSSHQ